jgi:hypothetical protein
LAEKAEAQAFHSPPRVPPFSHGQVKEAELGLLHLCVHISHEAPQQLVGHHFFMEPSAHYLGLPQGTEQKPGEGIVLSLGEGVELERVYDLWQRADLLRHCPSQRGGLASPMSSDAGLDHFTGPPSSVFQVGLQLANRSLACVIVADATFSPLKRPPAVAIVIKGLERIPHLNSFISELIGGLAMSFVRGRYDFLILANMDCKSVTDMQASQAHLPPAEAQAQGKVYNQVLRAFHQVWGFQPPIVHRESHPERPRPPKKNSPGCWAIPEDQWTHSNWQNHLADRYVSGSGATAGLAKRNLEPTKVFTFQVEDTLNSVVPPDSLY